MRGRADDARRPRARGRVVLHRFGFMPAIVVRRSDSAGPDCVQKPPASAYRCLGEAYLARERSLLKSAHEDLGPPAA